MSVDRVATDGLKPAVCLIGFRYFPTQGRGKAFFVSFRYKKSAAQQNASAVFGMAECLQKSGDDLKAFKWSSHSPCTLTLLHAYLWTAWVLGAATDRVLYLVGSCTATEFRAALCLALAEYSQHSLSIVPQLTHSPKADSAPFA